jgi:hypothetical protein
MTQATHALSLKHILIMSGIFALLFFFQHPLRAHAQLTALQGGADIQLVVNPEFPHPNELVTVSLDDYHLDTTGASIAWFVNEIEQKEYRNTRTLSVTTGAIGKKTTVRVALSKANAQTLAKSITLTPSVIDIILEANTYIPQFYKGRALPSTESAMRAIAIVHDNTHNLESTYSYKWTLGSTVLLGGQVKGKYALDLAMPHYDSNYLTVEVFDANGTTVGSNTLVLKATEPELHFYDESPLRGLSEREIQSPFQLIGDEITIYSEPYFMNIVGSSATTEWKVNNTVTEANPNAPNSITLRHQGGSGGAQVMFSETTNSTIPQFVKKAFQLIF